LLRAEQAFFADPPDFAGLVKVGQGKCLDADGHTCDDVTT